MNDWLGFFTESSRTYVDMAVDVMSRASGGGYQASDWLDDARAYWDQLAKDWSTAWSYGLESWEEVQSQGMDAGFPPPGQARETARGMASSMANAAAAAMSPATPGLAQAPARSGGARAEGTTVPLPGLDRDASPQVSRLESIEAGGATIDTADIRVSVVPLPGGVPGVRVVTTNTVVPAGLYVGTISAADGTALAPVQLFVSRAEAPAQ